MRISDCSSGVCSSDLWILEVLDHAWFDARVADQAQRGARGAAGGVVVDGGVGHRHGLSPLVVGSRAIVSDGTAANASRRGRDCRFPTAALVVQWNPGNPAVAAGTVIRSEEPTRVTSTVS